MFLVFQSQDVTYAQLSLPRGKGYTQMRVVGPDSVLYAKIDHTRTEPGVRSGCLARPSSPGSGTTAETPLVGSSGSDLSNYKTHVGHNCCNRESNV